MLLFLPSTLRIEFVGDCHLCSFFIVVKKEIVGPAGPFGAPAMGALEGSFS